MSYKEKILKSERIKRVIELCKSVEELGLDPFSVDVNDIIMTLQEYFPEWESIQELTLDAKAVQCVASVIHNQGDWVKHRSTSLYTDPFLLEEKIQMLSKEELAVIFAEAWNPIIEMEQLSIFTIAEALGYWNDLVPIDERWLMGSSTKVISEPTSREELVKMKILAEKTFREDLEVFWNELKQKVGEDARILYLDFVGANTYKETLNRAYMTSFLVTYGYATLEIRPLEETVFIKPFDEPNTNIHTQQSVSIPIAITHNNWKKWKRGELH